MEGIAYNYTFDVRKQNHAAKGSSVNLFADTHCAKL